MEKICEEKLCCGCSSCGHICPTHAIIMRKDNLGFLRPFIDNDRCVNCNMCKKACPINESSQLAISKKTFAAKAKNKHQRLEGQSGGAFGVFANFICSIGGVVFGVGTNGLNVVYKSVTKSEELIDLKTSKYVQAEIGDTYDYVAQYLMNGRKVLFSGTPCYVSGLLNYLKVREIETDNLITLDLVCFGVPSPSIYDQYIMMEEENANSKIKKFIFRDKQWSLNEKYSRIIWNDRKNDTLVNGYLKLFSSELASRDSCNYCKFASNKRVSDVTVGDYWGIEKLKPTFDDNRGVSLVLLNTNKGENLFEQVKDRFTFLETTFDDAQREQPALTHPIGQIKDKELFLREYREFGIKTALVKYCDYDSSCHIDINGKKIVTKEKTFLKSHFRGLIKTYCPRFLRRIMRKVFGK